MKITLINIGKTDQVYLNEGVTLFENRLQHYTPFEIINLPEVKKSKKQSEEKQKLLEAHMLIKHLSKYDYIVLLDEHGEIYTSEDFAGYVQQLMNRSLRNLAFITGGPYGFHPQILMKANAKISLSKMTFSHQMVRLIFTEQLYRAFTIIRGEPYHHK